MQASSTIDIPIQDVAIKWSEMLEKLNKMKDWNPLAGNRPVFIGFDTNCFRNRVYTNLKREIKYLDSFGFILSKTVQHELRSTDKIKQHDLDALKEALPHHLNIIQEF
ncbi:MAG: hypothetical protein ACTSX4_01135 [Candidatus Helarchaeota archaeon]